MLTQCLLPFAAEDGHRHWIFQQDNASCHRSKFTKGYLFDNDVDVLPWPARSPDFNIIENLWGIIFRDDIYKDSKQYADKEELKVAIQKAWNNIEIHTIRNLFDSMHKRCIRVLERSGRKTKY